MKKGNNIEIISRAVILWQGKILLCRMKGANWYFLPGGHIEFGEPIKKALLREIKEELGQRVSYAKLIGIAENSFPDGKKIKHEINFVFYVRLSSYHIKVTEKHIEFSWKDAKLLLKENLVPNNLKRNLTKWLENKQLFLNP